MIGGFGLCGIPENLINHIATSSEYQDLWAISCSSGIKIYYFNLFKIIDFVLGFGDYGLGSLLKQKKIKRLTTSFAGDSPLSEEQYNNGELAIEFCPQVIKIN